MDTPNITAALSEFNVSSNVTSPDLERDAAGTLPWTYWRRADGWIVYAQANDTEFRRQTTRKGMTQLPQYGEFFLANAETPIVQNGMQVGTLRGWRPNIDPFRLILLAGGAHEFPVEQVLALGWHRKPPIPGANIAFPQLAGVALHDVECPACHRWFLNPDDLKKHESVAHSSTAQQSSLARSIAEASTKENAPMIAIFQALATQIEQQGSVLAKLVERMETPAATPKKNSAA